MYRVLKMGNPLLHCSAEAIAENEYVSDDILSLAEAMAAVCQQQKSASLAAPQIGILKRMIAIGFPFADQVYTQAVKECILLNPRFTPISGEEVIDWEGCLSVPLIRGLISRYHDIECVGFDVKKQKEVTIIARGFEARMIQHEIDHLNGVIFPQKVKSTIQLFYEEELKQSSLPL